MQWIQAVGRVSMRTARYFVLLTRSSADFIEPAVRARIARRCDVDRQSMRKETGAVEYDVTPNLTE